MFSDEIGVAATLSGWLCHDGSSIPHPGSGHFRANDPDGTILVKSRQISNFFSLH